MVWLGCRSSRQSPIIVWEFSANFCLQSPFTLLPRSFPLLSSLIINQRWMNSSSKQSSDSKTAMIMDLSRWLHSFGADCSRIGIGENLGQYLDMSAHNAPGGQHLEPWLWDHPHSTHHMSHLPSPAFLLQWTCTQQNQHVILIMNKAFVLKTSLCFWEL